MPISDDQHQGIESLYARRARDEKKLATLTRRENAIRDRFQGYLDRYRILTSENDDKQETQDEQTDTG